MTLQDALLAIAVSVAAGALVGAERQQAHSGHAGSDFGGVRTFPLVALAGALCAMLRPFVGAWLLAVVLAGIVALLAISHARSKSRQDPRRLALRAVEQTGKSTIAHALHQHRRACAPMP